MTDGDFIEFGDLGEQGSLFVGDADAESFHFTILHHNGDIWEETREIAGKSRWVESGSREPGGGTPRHP